MDTQETEHHIRQLRVQVTCLTYRLGVLAALLAKSGHSCSAFALAPDGGYRFCGATPTHYCTKCGRLRCAEHAANWPCCPVYGEMRRLPDIDPDPESDGRLEELLDTDL